MEKQSISIVMTVFNGSLHLRQAIESILNQDHKNFEFIINDDCSTDESFAICREYAQKDDRIKLYCNEVNLGLVANFNKSFQYAAKEYFMWADQDDFWAPTFISSCLKEFTNSEIGLVATQTASISAETGIENFLDIGFNATSKSPVTRMLQYRSELYSGRHIGGPFCGVYLRSALKKSMPMLPIIAGDQVILFKLISRSQIITVKQKLCFKRFGGSSASLQKLARVIGLEVDWKIEIIPYLAREIEFQKTICDSKDNLVKKFRCHLQFILHFFYEEYLKKNFYIFCILTKQRIMHFKDLK